MQLLPDHTHRFNSLSDGMLVTVAPSNTPPMGEIDTPLSVGVVVKPIDARPALLKVVSVEVFTTVMERMIWVVLYDVTE